MQHTMDDRPMIDMKPGEAKQIVGGLILGIVMAAGLVVILLSASGF